MEQTTPTECQQSAFRQEERDYQVPASDGELLIDPPAGRWPRIWRENRERTRAIASQLGPAGLTWGELIGSLRRRALHLARRYTRFLGDDQAVADVAETAEMPILATGHQPLFYHPGIWAKNVVLELAAEDLQRVEDVSPVLINLVVDSDAADGLGAAVPEYTPSDSKPSWRVVQHAAPVDRSLPFESVLPPGSEELGEWTARITSTLATVQQPGLTARWQAAQHLLTIAAVNPYGAGVSSERWTIAEWTTAVRRRWEKYRRQGAPRYLDLPASWLARTHEFLWYVLDIIARAEAFNSVYNEELSEYRRRRRIRSRANPFPDLAAGTDFWELPFWLLSPTGASVAGRQRTALACRRLASRGILVYPLEMHRQAVAAAEGVWLPAPPGPGADARGWATWRQEAWGVWQASGWEVRPKAVTLTLFVRMALADLFIHGVGGGRYDRVTEAVARSFYGSTLPSAAVSSFTAHLPLPVGTGAAETMRSLRASRRELEQNPQRHLDLLSDAKLQEEAVALARTKEELIGQLAQAERHEKKTLARQLSLVTAKLAQLFQPVIASLDAEIACLEIRAREEEEVGRCREYPFFLYDPARLYAQIRAEWEKLQHCRGPLRG